MECAKEQEMLSAYYDGELSSAERAAVAEHITNCPRCAAELAAFSDLSEMADALADPPVPSDLWSRIERDLDAPARAVPGPRGLMRALWLNNPRWVAMAASVIVVFTAAFLGYQSWFGGSSAQVADQAFQQYVERFQRDPEAAGRWLLADYRARPLDLASAELRGGFRPVVAGGLPTGYTLESAHLVEMPGGPCVHAVCRRSDGSALAVFERVPKADEKAGGCVCGDDCCDGSQCQMHQINETLTVCQPCGNHFVTLVGARNVQEAGRLVAWWQRTAGAGAPADGKAPHAIPDTGSRVPAG